MRKIMFSAAIAASVLTLAACGSEESSTLGAGPNNGGGVDAAESATGVRLANISTEASAKQWAAIILAANSESQSNSQAQVSSKSAVAFKSTGSPNIDGQMDSAYEGQSVYRSRPCDSGNGFSREVDASGYYFQEARYSNCSDGYSTLDGGYANESATRVSGGNDIEESYYLADDYYLAKDSALGVEGQAGLTHKSLALDGYIYDIYRYNAQGWVLTHSQDMIIDYQEVNDGQYTSFSIYSVGDGTDVNSDGVNRSSFNGFIAFDNENLPECLVGSFEHTTQRAETYVDDIVTDGGRYTLRAGSDEIVVDYNQFNEPEVYHNGRRLDDLPVGSGRCQIGEFIPE